MNSSETSLFHLLTATNTQYWAPPFQRRYRWGEAECAELVEDLWAAYSFQRDHFTGVLVLMRGQRDSEGVEQQLLIDGQQRLTTTLLLLLAARDLFMARSKENMTVETAQKKLMFFDDFVNRQAEADSPSRLRVLPTLDDRPTLEAIERGQPLTKEQSKSAVAQAYFVLRKELDKRCIRAEQLIDVLRKGLPHMQVVSLHFKEGDNACAAFSNINAKGVQLSGVDLIKNFLLMEVTKQWPTLSLQEADTKVWQRLRQEMPESMLEDFFHAFVYLHVAGVKKQRVYVELTEHFKKCSADGGLEKYIDNLLMTARAYKEVSQKNCEFKQEGERFSAFCAHLASVAGVGGKVMALSLLTAFRSERISQKQLEQAVRHCEAALLRYFFYGESNHVAEAVGEYANTLQSVRGPEFLDKLKQGLQRRINPTDDQLRTKLLAFSDPKWTSKTAKAVRYALWLLEQRELRSQTPVNIYSVEHIWPQKWQKTTWADGGMDASSIEPMISGLGNFALIQPKLNSELGNKDSKSKVVALAKSGVFSNHTYFESVAQWDLEAIQKRRVWLVDQLMEHVLRQPD